MQTLTAFQFQSALLEIIRAMPTAHSLLQQGSARALGEQTQPPDIPEQLLIYLLPTLLRHAGSHIPSQVLNQVPPALQHDLVLLQATVTGLIAHPIAPEGHARLRSQISARLKPSLAAIAQMPESAWIALINGPQHSEHPQHTPITAALAALLTVSENPRLTVRLAQLTAREHNLEPEITGAIAGLLAGLCSDLSPSPRTTAERAIQQLGQILFQAWAGLGIPSLQPLSGLPRSVLS